ncbi:hypothetical protein RclHR1_14190001, partial [Rhizophagus clarus]
RRKAKADLAEFNQAFVFNRYQKWKGKELNSRQIILNLQNNPSGNMATIQDVMHTLAPLLVQLPNYDGTPNMRLWTSFRKSGVSFEVDQVFQRSGTPFRGGPLSLELHVWNSFRGDYGISKVQNLEADWYFEEADWYFEGPEFRRRLVWNSSLKRAAYFKGPELKRTKDGPHLAADLICVFPRSSSGIRSHRFPDAYQRISKIKISKNISIRSAVGFAPVSANDPYAAGNPAINTEPLFLNWLREKYREVMVGTNRSAIFAFVNEKFLETDTPDSYGKRIKPLVQVMPDTDALPYLFNQLPSDLEMRPYKNKIWLESKGRITEQQSYPNQALPAQPQKDDFKIRLARDLAYTGIGTDDATLENFIYEELKKRLGGQTAHVRKSPFTPKSAYATKKVVRKVVQKAKQTRNCSACGKAGHTKLITDKR